MKYINALRVITCITTCLILLSGCGEKETEQEVVNVAEELQTISDTSSSMPLRSSIEEQIQSQLKSPKSMVCSSLMGDFWSQPQTVESVIAAIENGADVMERDDVGQTPLMLALQSGVEVGVVDTLINHGAKVVDRDSVAGRTVLIYAIENNANLDTVRILIEKGANPNAIDKMGQSPMYWAVKQYGLDVIQYLIEAGGDIDAQHVGWYVGSGACVAAHHNPNVEVTKFFIERGVSVDHVDDKSNPLIYHAFQNKTPEVTLYLLKLGANVNVRTEHLRSCLMSYDYREATADQVAELLSAGGDFNACNDEGFSIFSRVAEKCGDPDIIDLLVKAGVDLNKASKSYGITPLMIAARENKNPAVIERLLKNGADARIKDSKGRCAVDYADGIWPSKKNDAVVNTDVYWKLNVAKFQ